jgi:predicted alpha/beta superfamily hydrolase
VFSDLDIVFSLLHRDYTINEEKNLTIPCGSSDNPSIWTRDGNKINSNYNVIIVSVRQQSPVAVLVQADYKNFDCFC